MPPRRSLVNIHNSLKINYPDHFLAYFVQIVEEQLRFHQPISNVDDWAKSYWTSLMIEQVGSRERNSVAFYGTGLYRRAILNDWLPKKYHREMLFDTDASGKGMISDIRVLSKDDLKKKQVTEQCHHHQSRTQTINAFIVAGTPGGMPSRIRNY